MKKKQISGTALKYFAIIAMTVDHIALLFFSAGTIPYYIMRLFGRFTAPIMTYLLVEGYRHTRDRKVYFKRLVLFAGIAQPIYFLFEFGRLPKNALEFLTNWNVLYTLAVALVVLVLFDSQRLSSAPSLILLGVLIGLSHFGDWSYLIPAWAIIFYCYQSDRCKMMILYCIASVTLQTLIFAKQFDSFAAFSFQYGTLFALIPISMYSGKRGGEKHLQLNHWFFYIYYPAHMIVLLVIRAMIGKL